MNEGTEMIGYCGYSCHLCGARSEDPAVRQSLVDGWRKLFGYETYTVENVKCDGCLSDGQVADKECRARPCARENGVKNCAYCESFPCEKLKPLVPPIFFATEAEYNLCIRQFESRPNLTRMLIEKGRSPFWVDR